MKYHFPCDNINLILNETLGVTFVLHLFFYKISCKIKCDTNSDIGKEFACYDEVEKLGIDFYFADPYSAWQRGSNENSNGLLREYYPKKTDLAEISEEDLIKNLMEFNSRPRKCLNYQTPFELFLYELSLI